MIPFALLINICTVRPSGVVFIHYEFPCWTNYS